MQLPDINVQMWPADFSSLFSFGYTHNPVEIKNKTKQKNKCNMWSFCATEEKEQNTWLNLT